MSVRLEWPGRAWRVGAPLPPANPCHRIERVGAGASSASNEPHTRLVRADALELASLLESEGTKVDCVYVDPPYASERDYVSEARLDGPADGRVTRTAAYGDKLALGAYLDMLAPRLEGLARLLAPKGVLWVHLDWRAAYLIRAILDEIFGRDAFLNEIVWKRAPNLGRQAASGQFGRTLDTLVAYGKPGATLRPPTRLEPIEPNAIRTDDEGRPFTSAPRGDYTDASIAKLDAEGRVHRTASGKVYIKYFLVKNEEGVLCRERRVDALWTDVAPLRHAATSERTGYPTQKPRALLERVIAASTQPGGLVVDAFAGSGTTGAAARAIGRRVILGDEGAVAIAVSRARLLRELPRGEESFALDVVGDRPSPSVEAQVTAEKVRGGKTRVRLITPAEPLAWSVGTMQNDLFHTETFRTLWHAERTPGAKSVKAEREAIVTGKDLVARVYQDDGSVATTTCTPQTAAEAHP